MPVDGVGLLQALVSGILVGGVYGLFAIGFSLAFGVMRIVNFAHGELVMLGMYVGLVGSEELGIDPLLMLPVAALLLGLLGLGCIPRSSDGTPAEVAADPTVKAAYLGSKAALS